MVKCRRLLENEVVDMSKFLVFGHQNPDTDAIASSYGWAHLEREVFGRDA